MRPAAGLRGSTAWGRRGTACRWMPRSVRLSVDLDRRRRGRNRGIRTCRCHGRRSRWSGRNIDAHRTCATVCHADRGSPGGRLAACRRPSLRPTPSNSPSSNAAVSSSPATPVSRSCWPPTARSSHSWATPPSLVLPRSSLKPLQALAMLTAGAPARRRAAGARHGQPLGHRPARRRSSATSSTLRVWAKTRSGARLPGRATSATRDELVRERSEPARVRMNCSGKHAAMLAACVTNGWDAATYLDPEHPLQAHIRDVIERLIGEKVAAHRDRRMRRARCTRWRCSALLERSTASATPRRARPSLCTAARVCSCRPCARTRGRSTDPTGPIPSSSSASVSSPRAAPRASW